MNTKNAIVYQLTDPAEILANYALNSTFGGTAVFANKISEAKLVELARAAEPEFVAQLAIYSYTVGKLRDVSALLTAYISAYTELFIKVAPRVLDNIGQIRKFVNYKRSGICGSRSLGTVPKRYIQNFIIARTPDQLFFQSIGSNPSIADVIRLTHPHPTPELEATFKYLLGYEVEDTALPESIQAFKLFQAGQFPGDSLPAVPVQMLEPHLAKLTPAQLFLYVDLLTPNQLRSKLNLLHRVGAFDHTEFDCTTRIEEKLRLLGKGNNTTLPLSLVNTANSVGVPELSRVVMEQFETMIRKSAARLNALIKRPLTLALDCSGSMKSAPDLGNGQSVFDIGAIFAYGLQDNPLVQFGLVNTAFMPVAKVTNESYTDFRARLDVRGGTALSAVLRSTDTLDTILISDNETWADRSGMNGLWISRRERNKNEMPHLVLWDLVPNAITPTLTDYSVLNVGGISENVYDTIANFFEGSGLLEQIRDIAL